MSAAGLGLLFETQKVRAKDASQGLQTCTPGYIDITYKTHRQNLDPASKSCGQKGG